MVKKKLSTRKVKPNIFLKARLATIKDEKLLLSWVNDPLVRANALKTSIISPVTHHVWFNSRLQNSKSCKILIIEKKKRNPLAKFVLKKKINGL